MSAAREQHLAVQVAELDHVPVHERQLADPAAGEAQRGPASEAAHAEHDHPRVAQADLAVGRGLTVRREVGEVAELAVVAARVRVRTARRRRSRPRRAPRSRAIRSARPPAQCRIRPRATPAWCARRAPRRARGSRSPAPSSTRSASSLGRSRQMSPPGELKISVVVLRRGQLHGGLLEARPGAEPSPKRSDGSGALGDGLRRQELCIELLQRHSVSPPFATPWA